MRNIFCIYGMRLFCFLLGSLFTASFLWAQGEGDGSASSRAGTELVIASEASWCLTDTECSFSVVLPEVPPSQVGIGEPSVPAGVSFLAASKDLWVEGSTTGTAIRLLFRFSQSGTVTLPPLDVTVDGRPYQLPFASVEVFQNPRSLKPQAGLFFQDETGEELSLQEDGAFQVVAGKALFVTVSLQYAAALTGLSWDLSPDALFQQVASYGENFNQGAAELSHQFQPVARFSLTPLKAGILQLPAIRLEVRGYDEKSYTLTAGNVPVPVQPGTEAPPTFSGSSPEALSALASAFSQLPATEQAGEILVSLEAAQELALLRWKERRSFPWISVYQQRQKLELELGQKPGGREPSLPLGWLGIGLALLTLAATVLTIVRKKIFFSVALGFLCVLAFAVSTAYLVPSFQPTGILASKNLSKIPEADATHLFPVAPYALVRIQEEVQGWYYVAADGLEGWVPREMVVVVQRPREPDSGKQ